MSFLKLIKATGDEAVSTPSLICEVFCVRCHHVMQNECQKDTLKCQAVVVVANNREPLSPKVVLLPSMLLLRLVFL